MNAQLPAFEVDHASARTRYGLTVEDDAGLADLAARFPSPTGVWCATAGFNRVVTAAMAAPAGDA